MSINIPEIKKLLSEVFKTPGNKIFPVKDSIHLCSRVSSLTPDDISLSLRYVHYNTYMAYWDIYNNPERPTTPKIILICECNVCKSLYYTITENRDMKEFLPYDYYNQKELKRFLRNAGNDNNTDRGNGNNSRWNKQDKKGGEGRTN